MQKAIWLDKDQVPVLLGLSIALLILPGLPSMPTPPKVQGVTVTISVQGSSPALRVSWSAVSGSGINYTVCYSKNRGNQTYPPSGANCSGITGTSTTLGPLSGGTTYFIWVRAESSGGQGAYSDRTRQTIYSAPGPVTSLQVRPSTTIYGLVVTWGPPSGSNYQTPVTYRVRYRERPSSEPPGSWSLTRTATQREYTTPTLKPGTSYEVEVWTVSRSGHGPQSKATNTTYQAPGIVTSLHVRPSNITLYGLIITWGPPSGSNYPTPLTYRVRYHERPSSGPPGSWSGTVVRSATRREYTTPTLKPSTRYEVEVWAVTSIGKGKKETTFGTVADTVKNLDFSTPGPVVDLKFSVVSPSSVNVTWSEPTDPGSGIVCYNVTYGILGMEDTIGYTSICSKHLFTTLVDLMGKKPYKVIVRGVSDQREGQAASIIVFSSQGVPSKGVDQISIIWTNENSVNVSWDPLSLLDCRGFPYYIVSYSSLEKGTTGSLNTTGSSVIFSGLDQQQSGYIFTFQVTTGNGTINGPVTVKFVRPSAKGRSIQSYMDSGVVVGVFLGGLVAGVLIVLLVVGAVCGVCTLIQRKPHPEPPATIPTEPDHREEVAYDTAGGVVVITSPACDEVELEQKDVWRPHLST